MTSINPSISRRDFAKALGVGAASATVLPRAARAAKPNIHYGMVIDTRRCTGCHACSVACKAEFNVTLGNTRSWVEYIEKGNFPNVSRQFLPRLCNQCSNPQCANVCPTGATYKRDEDGIVVVDEDVCIGCKYCILACPYDARYVNPDTGTVDKCDFCLHRVSQGVAPACVDTCTGRARIFGDLHDPESEVSKLIANNPVTVLRQGMGTQPNVYYIAADHSDARDRRFTDQYVRVDTHRRAQERR